MQNRSKELKNFEEDKILEELWLDIKGVIWTSAEDALTRQEEAVKTRITEETLDKKRTLTEAESNKAKKYRKIKTNKQICNTICCTSTLVHEERMWR